MKRFLSTLTILAALSCVSCELFDPEYSGSDDRTEESRYWSVVGKLVDVNSITPDYQGKTFKPAIGSPDGGDQSIRVVGVNSLEAAVSRYNSLTGAEITETTKTHTFKDKAVGTLTWNLSTDNTCWATVDVSIPSVPSLQKIIYRSPDQGDVNGSVGDGGSAYYRFGDVIKRFREEDGQLEYWICVRPAFDYEGKEKSHWVSVSPLPMSNVWPYYKTQNPFTASNKMEYGLPYLLRDDPEWYQDLAEMLFAICYPDAWFSNITSYSSLSRFGSPRGLPIFNDWHVDLIKYHNSDFWKNVQDQWRQKGLVKMLFGITYEEMENKIRPKTAGDSGPGLYFIYDDYSWNTITSNSPKLYQVHYYHGDKEEQRNMHLQTKSRPSAKVVTPNTLPESNTNFPMDVYKLTLNKPYLSEPRFFGDAEPRWTIRYATGAELSENGRYDAQQPLSGFTKEEEVYRYYRDVMPLKNLTDGPEETSPHGSVINERAGQNLGLFDGTGHYNLGDVFTDQNGHHWFVVKTSGMGGVNNPYCQKSPYAELMSFEGIQFSADGKTATNIVTRDQALYMTSTIWALAQEANKKIRKSSYGPGEDAPSLYHAYQNVINNAGVSWKHLAQELMVEKYHDAGKGAGESWSIAYYEPGSNKQRLMRCVVMMGEAGAFMNIYYDLYPSVPTTTNTCYWDFTPADFGGNNPVCLQDVADAQKVAQYGNDFIARAATFENSSVLRDPRTNVEPRAADPRNYLYNLNTWSAGTQPLGMWNEPVLLFRITALYDRGIEYATKSTDGLQMTLVSKGGLTYESEGEFFMKADAYNQPQDRRLNGTQKEKPHWNTIWPQ